MEVTLRESLGHDSLGVMNFLNEVVLRYPDAISFAPGRPSEAYFGVEDSLAQIGRFVSRRARAEDRPRDTAFADLGQYGPTNGLIRELLARHLRRDEQIEVPPEAIIVTVGCQEAMSILMMGLFDPEQDVLLVSDPTYIGITGLAQILGVPVVPIAMGENGLEPEALDSAIVRVKASGKRPKAVYDIPDFNNPLGTSLPIDHRRRLLAVARRHRVLIFEDNPYGMFSYDRDPLPTLKALDGGGTAGDDGVVIYLGSFSKTLYPGLRLGYLVADQPVRSTGSGAPSLLAQELSRVKSLTTVNTSPLIQAIAAGLLQENGGSLVPLVRERLPFYRANRDTMLASLERSFKSEGLLGTVDWNRPEGGFFLTVSLPFEFDEACMERCAQECGVMCCPMSFFSLGRGREHQIRLSFSYVARDEIEEGVRRLARFVADRLPAGEP